MAGPGWLGPRPSDGVAVRMIIHVPGGPAPDLTGMTDPVRLTATACFHRIQTSPGSVMPSLSASLGSATARLAGLDLAGLQRTALDAAAEGLRAEVRELLSNTPGAEHATPWRKTGALHDSVGASPCEGGAVVGSTDPVAIDQELGTRSVQPRPFLAPAAVRQAPGIAAGIADAVAEALRLAVTGVAK